MKAITLTQPWATLVAIGAKRIETRSWSTAYRGPLAIHAAHGLGPHKRYSVFRELCESEPFRSVLAAAGYTRASHLPTGVVLAVVDVVDVQPTAGPRGEQGTGPWRCAVSAVGCVRAMRSKSRCCRRRSAICTPAWLMATRRFVASARVTSRWSSGSPSWRSRVVDKRCEGCGQSVRRGWAGGGSGGSYGRRRFCLVCETARLFAEQSPTTVPVPVAEPAPRQAVAAPTIERIERPAGYLAKVGSYVRGFPDVRYQSAEQAEAAAKTWVAKMQRRMKIPS